MVHVSVHMRACRIKVNTWVSSEGQMDMNQRIYKTVKKARHEKTRCEVEEKTTEIEAGGEVEEKTEEKKRRHNIRMKREETMR